MHLETSKISINVDPGRFARVKTSKYVCFLFGIMFELKSDLSVAFKVTNLSVQTSFAAVRFPIIQPNSTCSQSLSLKSKYLKPNSRYLVS